LFVWDCDATQYFRGLRDGNNTFGYLIPKNLENSLAVRGIENAFPEGCFHGFVKEIKNSNGEIKRQFDDIKKREFAEKVSSSEDISDFAQFDGLIEKIREIQTSKTPMQ
ncbi:MAG: hypothetical protein AAFY57_19995, partial [Cyanobacteria bacterium J06642_2]